MPDVDFVVEWRQLTACENEGKHHLFIHVYDQNGEGMPGMQLRIAWVGGETVAETGNKLDVHPGFVDFAMYKGSYTVEVLGFKSEVAGPVTPDIPQGQLCEATGNPVANSLYHYSYEITFRKVR